MTENKRGTGWFVVAIFFGLIAIAIVGIGLYAIWHTDNNVQIHRGIVERQKQELDKLQPVLHIPGNHAKAEALGRMIEFDRQNVYRYEATRNMAFLIAASSVVPIALSVVFLSIYLKKRNRLAVQDHAQ